MYKTRYLVRWDENGEMKETVCEGAGARVKALSLRDRLPEDSGAHVVREKLEPVWTWVNKGVVDDIQPARKVTAEARRRGWHKR